MSLILTASWSVALLLSQDALAARKPEVAVVGLHVASANDETGLEVANALSEALEQTGRVDAIPPGEVRGRMSGRKSLVLEGIFLGPGRVSLAEGRVLYERADFENAIPVLEGAAQALQDGMAGATSSKELIDCLLLLGLAHASIGEPDAARAAFKRVVVLDATRQLDAVNYPPKMVGMFNEVRQAVLALPGAVLNVTAAEDGAHVYVDGVERGEAPVKVDGLPPGVHYVLVQGADGRRSFSRVELGPGERMGFQAPLDQRALVGAGGQDTERARQVRQLYSSLGTHVATGLVLLGGELEDGRVALQLYETRTGNFSQVLRLAGGDDPAAAAIELAPQLVDLITSDGTLDPARVSGQVAPLDIDDNALLSGLLLDPEPIVETVTVTRGLPWYVWSGIAVVAAGGAATAVLILAPDPENPDKPDPDQGTILVEIP